MDNPAFQRHIKSFVLRQGHLSPAQQRALDTLYEEKGNVEEALQYTIGRGYDDAFHAAINAAKRAKLPNYIKA